MSDKEALNVHLVDTHTRFCMRKFSIGGSKAFDMTATATIHLKWYVFALFVRPVHNAPYHVFTRLLAGNNGVCWCHTRSSFCLSGCE